MITESKTGKIVALRDLWKAAIKVNASVAMWRLPTSSSVHFLVDFSNTPTKCRLNLQTK